ncbi:MULTISPECIES: hypothetical protein [Rhizobium]|uniref:hypothetical protein n=1 Tax=Rhizobium TaxID=379 RepID=UPI001B33DAEE|nr:MULTISPECIES: hypothetical protein [Rhizobium]MBX4906579.1 hypothetical protein [Rhizobium bangladeshense]MBX5230908.1 hypothetical protein [Rhizobium sp. NLR4a]MBX5237636.1 hypothetical protein [Rhizobium sp. NLR22b]MBX5251590.1 hypothetical protein [Rhizobium sp. NLR4b]MBX5255158.1 hypothetical protein [Rhizobium sp. NLR16b]
MVEVVDELEANLGEIDARIEDLLSTPRQWVPNSETDLPSNKAVLPWGGNRPLR